ncbi:hypothetical protein GQ54DRAFT_180312 [Martensiomyces pterosporus]|nr:hypothetical protein GQ54DRAFT_180312 [Martensiomyces pterosporus]
MFEYATRSLFISLISSIFWFSSSSVSFSLTTLFVIRARICVCCSSYGFLMSKRGQNGWQRREMCPQKTLRQQREKKSGEGCLEPPACYSATRAV